MKILIIIIILIGIVMFFVIYKDKEIVPTIIPTNTPEVISESTDFIRTDVNLNVPAAKFK